MNTQEYFEKIEKEVKGVYEIAEKAKSKGYDPASKVEIPLAKSLAEKVVGLISAVYPQLLGVGVAERIIELEKEYGKLDPAVCLQIAEEVAKQKYCKFESVMEAIDAGARLGFAYITLGVVSSPIEGFTEIKLFKTNEGKEYFSPYYSGPVRSAGGTGAAFSLVIIDHLREIFGYAKYDPTEEEINRMVTELTDYHERVTNLQYMPSVEEIKLLAKKIPIQINGEASEKREVSNYKNLPRVDTDFIRSGVCLTFGEGLAQKAPKIKRYIKSLREKGFKLTDWDFLDEYMELHEKQESGESKGDESPTYIKDLVAGRPVFGHPSKSGGFRFRYGRGRTSGFSASSVHPATMAISDDFIAIGTQLKIEKPTKGTATTTNDLIEGPIIKLKNGTVKKLKSFEDAKKYYSETSEIIYLGDLLFPFSDLVNRNYDLIKPGYVEEWWEMELRKKSPKDSEIIDKYNVSFEEAIDLSMKYGIPLYPKFIFYWNQISLEQFDGLLNWLKYGSISEKKIILPYNKSEQERFRLGKRALELIGLEHEVTTENTVINKVNSKALFANLGLDNSLLESNSEVPLNGLIKESFNETNKENYEKDLKEQGEDVLKIINTLSELEIKDKAGDFVGTRMGRPEKAKLRKLQGSPNVLFPVGNEGGRLRSIYDACKIGSVKNTAPMFYCKKCDIEGIYPNCVDCGEKCERKYYYRDTKEKLPEKERQDGVKGMLTCKKSIDICHYYDKAKEKLGMKNAEMPALIKGVRGISSDDRIPERIEKGILRAKYNLQVNKDGTIRFDGTELPVTSFRASEISVSIKKLKEIGYDKDIYGKDIENENQLIELKPHDILLPSSPHTVDERADNVFTKVAKFVDEELESFYGLEKFYNINQKEDLVGHLGVCMAPHNCGGVVCRFIGFSKTQGIIASPYMHAAIRRDCFDYNTFIPLKDKEGWKIKRIGDAVEELNPENVVDNFGTKEKGVRGLSTVGLNKNMSDVKINNFTKHTKTKMFEIKTSLGKKINVTEGHKFSINGKFKKAKELEIGDMIQMPYNIKIPSKNISKLNLINSLNKEGLIVRRVKRIILRTKKEKLKKILSKLKISNKQFQNFKIRDSFPVKLIMNLPKKIQEEIFEKGYVGYKRDRISVPIKISMDKELLEIIGLYVAEGYSRRIKKEKGLNQVYIAAEKEEIRKHIIKTMKKHFGLKPSEKKKDRVTFSSGVFYEFIVNFLKCGSNAKEKRIPGMFLNLTKDKLAAFLRGYFEGDGSVSFSDKRVSCDSISEGLLYDLEFCLSRFGIFAKRYEYEKEPWPKLRKFYFKKRRKIPKFKITKITIGSDFIKKFNSIGFISNSKKNKLDSHDNNSHYGMRIKKDESFVYDPVVSIKDIGEKESYCLNVDTKKHMVFANSILSHQCDGDEAAIMMLTDVLLNFSKSFLPNHRGGTQDAPLVLNSKINAGEVDDQILDFEILNEYPLELYQLAEKRKHSSEIDKKVNSVKDVLKEGKNPFINLGFTHDTSDFNLGVPCSSYKLLGTMSEKIEHQMALVSKLRSVDTSDTARLVIERHFIRDLRGNLRSFSTQDFRCVKCNEILRRPPLKGICPKCGGKIIFTIHEGGIKKYLEPALNLAYEYDVSEYLKQNLELVKRYINSIFGIEPEQQEKLKKWF